MRWLLLLACFLITVSANDATFSGRISKLNESIENYRLDIQNETWEDAAAKGKILITNLANNDRYYRLVAILYAEQSVFSAAKKDSENAYHWIDLAIKRALFLSEIDDIYLYDYFEFRVAKSKLYESFQPCLLAVYVDEVITEIQRTEKAVSGVDLSQYQNALKNSVSNIEPNCNNP